MMYDISIQNNFGGVTMTREEAVVCIHKLNYIYLSLNKCMIDDWEKIVQLGGLTYPQSKLLIILRENGECTMSMIAEKGLWHMSTVTELVNRMDKEGYVEKQIDQMDKRVVRVRITQKGIDVLDSTKRLYYKNSDVFNALLNMDKKDLDNSFDIIVKVCKNIKHVTGPCPLSDYMEKIENPKCNCLDIMNSVYRE